MAVIFAPPFLCLKMADRPLCIGAAGTWSADFIIVSSKITSCAFGELTTAAGVGRMWLNDLELI